MSDIVRLFGAEAPWVVGAGALLVGGMLLVAFCQGRTVSIWPPRIGPRSDPGLSARGGDGADRPGPRRDREARGAGRVYSVDRAIDFYQRIAPSYDQRNSPNLVSTHLATVAQLQAIRAQSPTLRVLDLGGGTGKLIAVHFFNDEGVFWTYVDFCPAMAAEFRGNLADFPLGRNATVVTDDLNRALRHLRPASFDVVLLSLVLSSMSAPPDFAAIARLLADNGSLITTDINPGYTHAHPLYEVPVEGTVVALRTTPVDPFEVIRRATAAGLRMTGHRTLGEVGEGADRGYYSFMTVFTPAAVRPPGLDRGGDTLLRS